MEKNIKSSNHPAIGIIHNLARCGGTLVGRCIGSMDDVRLLSEIHPQGLRYFNPLNQAEKWFNIIDKNEFQLLVAKLGVASFVDAIEFINNKCVNEGSHLVLRDWAYLDFFGQPFNSAPSGQHVLLRVLETAFRINEVSLVRHPVDQWISLTKDKNIAKALTLNSYMKGCLRYAKLCPDHLFIRYEDFTKNPEYSMQEICKGLQIKYDKNFMRNWSSYMHITGDPGRSKRESITEVCRYSVPKKLGEQFRNNKDYEIVLNLLGYDDPT